jgi:hypothetical protein
MDRRTTAVYLAGAVIVWIGTLVALAVVLSGSGRFGEVLTVLLGAIAWFLLLVPAGLSRAATSRSAGRIPGAPRPGP